LERYGSTLRYIEPEDQCRECGGSGIKTYGDTTTWRRGIGGQSMTSDVCDKCWGSGEDGKPWPSRRAMKV
jgi:DnaJ-class molecular chaperone